MHRYVYNPYNPICVVYVPTDPKIVFCGSSMGPSLPVTKLANGIQRHGIVFLDLSRGFAVAPAESVPFKVYVNRSFAGISCIKKTTWDLADVYIMGIQWDLMRSWDLADVFHGNSCSKPSIDTSTFWGWSLG
jgi:hypothetical protein